MQSASLLPRKAGRVLLRRLVAADLAAFHAYRQDAVVGRYQGWSPMSESQALAFIAEMTSATLFEPGEWTQLAIARGEDNSLVGDIGLFVSETNEFAEVGCTVAPAAQGRGYGSEAVAAAISLLFEATAVERVLGVTDARNSPSVQLLERVGMQRIDSRVVVFKGEPCTEWVYAKRRSRCRRRGRVHPWRR